jgi:uncharacterized protein (DUF302 family)
MSAEALADEKEEIAMERAGIYKVLPLPFDRAIERVTAALAAEGFGILTEIDVRDTLKRKLAVEFRRYHILGACNPPLAHRALSADLEAGLMMPCNVLVWEIDASRTAVEAVDPERTVAAERPALRPIAAEVKAKLTRVIEGLG